MSLFIDISSCTLTGGIGRYVRDVIRTSPDDVVFVSRKKIPADIHIDKSKRTIVREGVSRPLWEFFVLPNILKKECRSMSAFWSPDWTLPQYDFSCPVFLTVHDPVPWLCPNDLNWKARFWFRARTPNSISKANFVFSDSKWACDELKRIFPHGSFLHFYPCISGLFDVHRIEKEENMGIKFAQKPKRILYLGAISPRKKLDLLLEAFSILKKDGYSMEWVGYCGKKSRSVLEKAKSLGVSFYKDCPDEVLKRKVRDAKCLVYPSEIEGFGLPIVEGMIAGVPVCALDTKVAREVGGNAVRYFSLTVSSLISNIEKSCNLTQEEYLLGIEKALVQLSKIKMNDISKAFKCISKKVK